MVNFFSIIFCLLVIVQLIVVRIDSTNDLPFKINKLNLIWEKAQHSLGSNKLKDLKNDLLTHETDELNLKKVKAHSQDKDGLIEASVRKKLFLIMKKYSIERYHDDVHPKSEAKSKDDVKFTTFRDSKLDKLWKKAEKVGFEQDQLMILHDEFQHQQDKLDEHYKTATMLEEKLIQDISRSDRLQNSIDNIEPDNQLKRNKAISKETPFNKKARLEMNVQQALREKHTKIKEGYDELHRKIKSGPHAFDGPFKESRVNELWAMASQSNFSQTELQSLREELEHYEIRIEKLKHFQNQLDRHKIGTKDYGSDADENDESKHIKRKVEELILKVEKIDKTIVGRIVKDEL